MNQSYGSRLIDFALSLNTIIFLHLAWEITRYVLFQMISTGYDFSKLKNERPEI